MLFAVFMFALPNLVTWGVASQSGFSSFSSTRLPVPTALSAVIAFTLPAILWALVLLGAVRLRLARRSLEPKDVPQYERELPSTDDPAVVAVLWGEGKLSANAIAGTVLALAQRGALAIEETGPGRFTLTVKDASAGANRGEQAVLAGLAAAADQSARIEGPPLWRGRVTWWRSYRRDTIGRAIERGLVTYLFRRGLVALASIMTGVGLGIFFFLTQPSLFMLAILASTFVGIAIAVAGGLQLTAEGVRVRAHWAAYARHIADFTEVERAPPATIAIWGPYLAYGAALGIAKETASALAPKV